MRYIIFFFLFAPLINYSQQYDKPPVSTFSIERSLSNLDTFRLTMLDNGLQFVKKDTNVEEWHVPLSKNDTGYIDPDDSNHKMALQMTGKTVWVQLSKISFQRSTYDMGDRITKFIRVQIRKDMLPEYKKIFEGKIRALYTIKKVFPITFSPGTKEERNDFEIHYFRKGNNVDIHMDDSDALWYIVDFSLTKPK